MTAQEKITPPAARNPLFVFGYPRSGTSLLRALIGQHSWITLTQGPELILGLHRAGYGPGDSIPGEELGPLFGELRKLNSCRRHFARLPPHVVEDTIAARRPLEFWELYERLVRPPDLETPLWGQKAHNNVFFASEIVERYPDALIVHVYRDCRAVVLSHLRKSGRLEEAPADGSPTEAAILGDEQLAMAASHAMRWDHWMAVATAVGERARPSSWIDVRYEDLVRDSGPILRRVCELAGVPFEREMMSAGAREGDPILRGDSAGAHHRLAEELDPSRIISFEGAPTVLDALVERYAGKRMRWLGYGLRRPRVRDRLAVRRLARRHEHELRADLRRHSAQRNPATLLATGREASASTVPRRVA